MKKLKGFVQQREKPEGSMEEGYIVYESFYKANEYIMQINHTLGAVIWDDECDEDKREGELLEMKGKRCMIRSKSLRFRYSHFHTVTIHSKLKNIYFIPYILNVFLFP